VVTADAWHRPCNLDDRNQAKAHNAGEIMVVADRAVVEWIRQVRAEYLQMPGLSLTKAQMRRLWRLDQPLCDAVVDALVALQFLERRTGDRYFRRSAQI
jgi:hypothetical protein